MPRSPSPPRRYPLPALRYRDEPSSSFRDRRDQGDRSWGDYHRQRRDLDRDRDERPDYRPRERSRSRSREKERFRETSPVKYGQPSETRSGTPEEGQITSPIRLAAWLPLPPRPRSPRPPFRRRSPSPPFRRKSPSPRLYRRRSPSPPPFRRRLPSPPVRRRSPSPLPVRRRYSPSPPPFRRRSPSPRPNTRVPSSRTASPVKRRSPGPQAYPNRPFDSRDRGFQIRSRSPPPPRRFSPTPSSLSTRSQSQSRSSRFPSPIKRHSPSPIKRRSRSRSRSRSPSPVKTRLPSPPRPTIPSPRHPAEPMNRESSIARPPPTGPKGVPTGPRALTGQAALPARPRPNPYTSSPSLMKAGRLPSPIKQEAEPSPSIAKPNPHTRVIPTQPSSAVGGATPRLSWSERKSQISPTMPIMGPEASASMNTNPYSASASTHGSAPIPVDIKPNPYTVTRHDSDVRMKGESSVTREKVEEKPRLSEVEIAEIRFREERARIKAELPALKVSHSGATWELELGNYYKTMQGLQQNTLRAQSAARHAAVVLADAEGERIAAMERRTVVEAQLVAGSLGMTVAVGIMGA